MRRFLVRGTVVGLTQCVCDNRLHAFEPCGQGVDQPLLLVQNSAQILDQALDVRVADFDFRKAGIVHVAQRS